MRADMKAGAKFPDYQLPDHTGTPRRLSELQGEDPMIIVLAREAYSAKDQRQQQGLAELLALAGPAGRVEAGDHLVAAAGGVAGAGVGGQLLQLLGGGPGALEAEVGVLVGPQRLQHVHGRLEGEALAPVAVHQGGVLEVLGPDADDQLAAGPGLPDLGAHLAR
jgi:hypothetical protein